jgi:hypothetical protein
VIHGKPNHLNLLLRTLLLAMTTVVLGVCTGTPNSPRQKYQLSSEEAEAWERLHVAEAESAAVALWGHIGRGEFDEAMLLVERFDDERMTLNFRRRIDNLWRPIIDLSAANFTAEHQIGLGPGEPVGFTTFGDLLTGGFQRAVICTDSITAYFVFNGHWQTNTIPVYAAVACGIFEVEKTRQWRPFAHLVFSTDSSEEMVKARGQAFFAEDIDQFMAFLRTRTFGSFGS